MINEKKVHFSAFFCLQTIVDSVGYTYQMNGEFKDMSNPQAHKNIQPEILDKINKSEIVKELGYLPPE